MKERLHRWVDYAGGVLAPDQCGSVERELQETAPDPAQLVALVTRLRRVALSRQPLAALTAQPSTTRPRPGCLIELEPVPESCAAGGEKAPPAATATTRRYVGGGYRLDMAISLEAGRVVLASGLLSHAQTGPVRERIGLATDAGGPLASLAVNEIGEFVIASRLPRRFWLVVRGDWLGVQL